MLLGQRKPPFCTRGDEDLLGNSKDHGGAGPILQDPVINRRLQVHLVRIDA